eukprot:335841-Rhodomonas_salina.1
MEIMLPFMEAMLPSMEAGRSADVFGGEQSATGATARSRGARASMLARKQMPAHTYAFDSHVSCACRMLLCPCRTVLYAGRMVLDACVWCCALSRTGCSTLRGARGRGVGSKGSQDTKPYFLNPPKQFQDCPVLTHARATRRLVLTWRMLLPGDTRHAVHRSRMAGTSLPIGLRKSYAVCGTGVAYGAMRVLCGVRY